MKPFSKLCVRHLFLTMVLWCCSALPAFGQGNFFRGKTITYVVATKPGGGYDTYGRLVAKYLEKHLPGAQVVVRNIPGAGHVIGANHLFAAEPDGLTIGTFNTGLVYSQLVGREGVKFDLRKLSWIGKASSEPRVLILGKDSGLGSLEALRAAEEPVLFPGSGFGSAAHTETMLLARALKVPVRMVLGFSGNEAEMSVLRGELAGMFGSLSSLRSFVENGHGSYVLRVGGSDSQEIDIPSAHELVVDQPGRAIVRLIESQAELGRVTCGPPEIPTERLEALRTAYRNALEDPALRTEAAKRKLPIVPLYGEEVARQITQALEQPSSTLKLLRSLLGKGS